MKGQVQGTPLSAAVFRLAQLARAGIAMREAQKAYFKDRTQSALIASKEAERTFDRLIADTISDDAATAPSTARSDP